MIQSFDSKEIPRDFLEALRLSMNFDFISKNDIRSWALMIVSRNLIYDPFLLDLIEGEEADAREIDFKIRTLTDGVQRIKNSRRILLGFITRKFLAKEMSEKTAATLLNDLCFQFEFPEWEKYRLYGLDHEIYLAEQGIHGDLGDVYGKIRKTLTPYHDFKLNNYNQWAKLNEEIELKLRPSRNS